MTTTATTTPTSISAAGALIVDAANRIQFQSSLEEILQRLNRESIHQVWQLEFIDSYQWERLAVPIGLVSSVRMCLEETRQQISSNDNSKGKNNNSYCNNDNRHTHENMKVDRRRKSPIRGVKLQHRAATTVSPIELSPPKTTTSGHCGIPSTAEVDMMRMSYISTITEPDGRRSPRSIQSAEEEQQQISKRNSPRQQMHVEESVDTFFPPSLPQRRISTDEEMIARTHNSSAFSFTLQTAEDHWTCGGSDGLDVKIPPMKPMRLASDQGADPEVIEE